jgi:hypothetical protein
MVYMSSKGTGKVLFSEVRVSRMSKWATSCGYLEFSRVCRFICHFSILVCTMVGRLDSSKSVISN